MRVDLLAQRIQRGALIFGVLSCTSFQRTAETKDFERRGHTFPIQEVSLLEVIQKTPHVTPDTYLNQLVQQAQHPRGLLSPKAATIQCSHFIDPSFVAQDDIKAPKGACIVRKGTCINPLKPLTLSSQLLFLDGAKEEQIKLAPTETNLKNYFKEQKKWIEQSARFTNTWQKVLLTHPMLGDFLTNPTTSFGIQARKDLELQRRKQLLKRLSETHFLLFFFRGKDPFSQKAAEVSKLFSSMNDWKVKAVSVDGHPVESFPDYEFDKGISQSLGTTVAPTMFVIEPSTAQAVPVGAGLLSVSQLETNIESQFQEEQHEN